MKKMMFLMLALFLFTGVDAQVKNLKVKGVIKGASAIEIFLLEIADSGRAPVEITSTIINKGKFEMTFRDDPSLGRRYALYIPMSDNDRRDNRKSYESFFADADVIQIEAKVSSDGFESFNVVNSSMYHQFRTARKNVNQTEYYRFNDRMEAAHGAFWKFKEEKDPARTGVDMTDADSVEYKRLDVLQREATKKFFESENELSLQVANMVSEKKDRGLNALVFDFFKGYNLEYTKLIVDRLLKFHDVNYLKNDYYLNKIYDRFLRLNVVTEGADVVDYDFVDSKGKNIRFGDLKGNYVYINMWDVRDPEYQRNIDAFEALSKLFNDRSDIVFINLNLNEDANLWKEELKQQKNLTTTQWSIGNNPSFYNTYKVGGTPRAMMIRKDGKIYSTDMSVPFEKETEKIIRGILK